MRVVETVVRNIAFDDTRGSHSGDVTFAVIHDSGAYEEVSLQVMLPSDAMVSSDKVHTAILSKSAERLRQAHGDYDVS